MTIFKKALSIICLSALLIMPLNVFAVEGATSGTTGDCVWEFDSGTGTITISGEGNMADYNNSSDMPWYHLKDYITKVIVDDDVRRVGVNAFYDFDKIKRVEIGNSVEIIDYCAFGYCRLLKDISFGNSLETIGFSAFSHCEKLENVDFPDKLKTIDFCAFSCCTSLVSINTPESLTDIEGWAFGCCYALKDVVLNDGLIIIDGNAFRECGMMERITIPDSVRYIGDYKENTYTPSSPFSYCEKLKDIIVGENNPYFTVCDGVIFNKEKTVLITYPMAKSDPIYAIPDSVSYLANYAFAGSALKAIAIPKSVTFIDFDAFEKIDNIKDVYYSGTVDEFQRIDHKNNKIDILSARAAIHYNSSADDMEYEYYTPVTSGTTGDCVWEFDSETGTITISGEGDMADYPGFYDMPWHRWKDNITKVIVDDGVKTVGERTFPFFVNIERVEIGDSVETIDLCAFYGCSSLKDISFGNSLVTIGSSAFFTCVNLESVDFPDSLNVIDKFSFYSCHKLTSIDLPKNVNSVGYGAFYSCLLLSDVQLNDGLEHIGTAAFSDDRELRNITIPDSVKYIGHFEEGKENSFENLIPGSPFQGCYNLSKITISDNNPYWLFEDGVLYSKDKRILVSYLSYRGIDPKLSFTVPDGVNCIASEAFCRSPCESITIPKSVVKIIDNPFSDCTKLKDVYYLGTKSEWKKITGPFNLASIGSIKIHFMESDVTDPTEPSSELRPTEPYVETTSGVSLETEPVTTIPPSEPLTEPVVPSEAPSEDPSLPTKPTEEPTTSHVTAPVTEPQTSTATNPASVKPSRPIASKTQTITAKSYNLVYGAKSFNIKAKAKGKLSFSAPKNSVIKLSANGKLRVVGCGIVSVTIKAARTKLYNKASKKITVTVRPQKARLKSGSGTTARYVIHFAKLPKISGYELFYREKGDKKWKKVYAKKNASSVVIKNLKLSRYDIKLRGFKLVGKKKLCGDFAKGSF